MTKEDIETTLSLLAEYIADITEACVGEIEESAEGLSIDLFGRLDTDPCFHFLEESEEYALQLYANAQDAWEGETGGVDDGGDEAAEYIQDFLGDIGYRLTYTRSDNRYHLFWTAGDHYPVTPVWAHRAHAPETPSSIVDALDAWVDNHLKV